MHKDKLDYWSENWRTVMTRRYAGESARKERGYAYWEYTGCSAGVFRCLQQWVYEQKIPEEESIREAGYNARSRCQAQAQSQTHKPVRPHQDSKKEKKEEQEGRRGKVNGGMDEPAEPLPCHLAVSLYFTAWHLSMPQLMDDALTLLYDYYTKTQQIPSLGMTHRVFSASAWPAPQNQKDETKNKNKSQSQIGQHMHYLFADLYLKFGVLDCSPLTWASDDVTTM